VTQISSAASGFVRIKCWIEHVDCDAYVNQDIETVSLYTLIVLDRIPMNRHPRQYLSPGDNRQLSMCVSTSIYTVHLPLNHIVVFMSGLSRLVDCVSSMLILTL